MMQLFDYIDSIEVPTIENLRIIYHGLDTKYDDLIDLVVSNSNKSLKTIRFLECVKSIENMMFECMESNSISEVQWLKLKCNLYKAQAEYRGLKEISVYLK